MSGELGKMLEEVTCDELRVALKPGGEDERGVREVGKGEWFYTRAVDSLCDFGWKI